MTTGTKTFGGQDFGYYYLKTWSGANGKYVSGKPTSKFYIKQNNYNCAVSSFNYIRGANQQALPMGTIKLPNPSIWSSNDEVALQGKLVGAVKGHDFNLGVFLGTSHETFKMLYSTIDTVVLTLVDLKHGRFRRASRRLGVKHVPSKLSTGDIAGRWLELQFGWLPLLSDVHESFKALALLTDPPRKLSVTVRGKTRESIIIRTDEAPWWANTEIRTTFRKQIRYFMTEHLSTPRALGLHDPLSVAWELVPYSFVVDWFIPIGNYLSNLNAIPNLDGTFVTTTYDVYEKKCRAPTTGVYRGARTWGTFCEVSRVVTTQLVAAKPTFKPLERLYSPKHFLNSIALARQKLK